MNIIAIIVVIVIIIAIVLSLFALIKNNKTFTGGGEGEEEGEERKKTKLNVRDLQIVASKIKNKKDLEKLSMVSKKSSDAIHRLHFNPVTITKSKDLDMFPNIQTYHIMNIFKDLTETLDKLPKETIIVIHDMPCSYNEYHFKKTEYYKDNLKKICEFENVTCYFDNIDAELAGDALDCLWNKPYTKIIIENMSYSTYLIYTRQIKYSFALDRSMCESDVNNAMISYSAHALRHFKNVEIRNITCDIRDVEKYPNKFEVTINNGKIKISQIPKVINTIACIAFAPCKKLASITIPKNIEYIMSGAFMGCNTLNQIIIENDDIYIAPDAFHGCTNLVDIKASDYIKDLINKQKQIEARFCLF